MPSMRDMPLLTVGIAIRYLGRRRRFRTVAGCCVSWQVRACCCWPWRLASVFRCWASLCRQWLRNRHCNATPWRGVGRSWPHHLQPARCSGHRPCKLGPLARKINDDVNKVLALPDVQERLDTYGAEDGGGSMEKVAQFIRSETAKWAKVVKDGNIKVDS